jgi:hypothetical protein
MDSVHAMMHPGSEGDEHAAPPPQSDAARLPPEFGDSEQLREELRILRQREREIVELLGSTSPQRINHDIRNLLNEVRLLRYLADKND